MRAAKLIAAAALASLGLAACNNGGGDRAGAASRICTPFAVAAGGAGNAQTPAPGVQPAAADPAAALDDCLHRWGYSLAAASDGAQEVAMATVAACAPALTRWNQQMLATATGPQGAAATETAPSLLTGQPTTPIAEHYNYAQARALFYVVQGRAGKCAPPPPPKATR